MANTINTSSKLSKALAAVMVGCITALCLLFFTRIGYNKIWFEKVRYYWDDFVIQKEGDSSLEQIKEERLGTTYKIVKQVSKYFEDRHVKNPVVLFEPNAYLQKTMGFTMPEPVIIYYYTGMKSVWIDSKTVKSATHIVRIKNGNISIDPIKSPQELQQILTFYKPYPTT